MKISYKSILAFCALITASQMSGAITDTGKRIATDNYETLAFLLSKYTYNNEIRMCLCDWDASSIDKFTVFDDKFNEVNVVSVPEYAGVTSTYTRRENLYGPINVTVSSSTEYSLYTSRTSISKEDFIQYCEGHGFTIEEKHGDELRYLSGNSYDYLGYEIYGYKYPQQYCVWRDGEGYRMNIEYTYDYGLTGIFGEELVSEDYERPRVMGLYVKSADGVEIDNHCTLTQTLFNNDELYEWVVEVYEAVDCSYQDEYEKVEGKKVLATGWRIESQNGTAVAEIKAPAGFKTYDLELCVIGEANYLLATYQKANDYSDAFIAVYEIDSQNASLKMVGAPHRVSVNPTTPRRGMQVNVDLGNPANENTRVIVTSVSGQVVNSLRIEPGVTGTTIDTSRLEKGMYIVTVSDGKTTRENTKIVIR